MYLIAKIPAWLGRIILVAYLLIVAVCWRNAIHYGTIKHPATAPIILIGSLSGIFLFISLEVREYRRRHHPAP